jgi:hypothetical protein
MLKAGFFLQDDAAPRTEYWERFLKALKQSAFFAESGPRILIPCEDNAIETNWPRYGDPASAYVRGQPHDLSEGGHFQNYVARIAASAQGNPDQTYLYLNMQPFFRAPLLFRHLRNVVVADVSLAMLERDLNRNTISMPALPIVAARSASSGMRPILASFQGVNSHPIRQLLAHIANGTTIAVNFVERDGYVGKIDAINGGTDQDYEQLLASSIFAFVPRGDALFSYRLAEAMSFGCIPVIVSDGWVLPFDRIVSWEQLGLRVHADAIPHLPDLLSRFTPEEIVSRQERVLSAYKRHFADLDAVISGVMAEAESLSRSSRTNCGAEVDIVGGPGDAIEATARMAAAASRPDDLYDHEEWDALMNYYDGSRAR